MHLVQIHQGRAKTVICWVMLTQEERQVAVHVLLDSWKAHWQGSFYLCSYPAACGFNRQKSVWCSHFFNQILIPFICLSVLVVRPGEKIQHEKCFNPTLKCLISFWQCQSCVFCLKCSTLFDWKTALHRLWLNHLSENEFKKLIQSEFELNCRKMSSFNFVLICRVVFMGDPKKTEIDVNWNKAEYFWISGWVLNFNTFMAPTELLQYYLALIALTFDTRFW